MSDDPFENAIAGFRQMAADAASARAMRDLAASASGREQAPLQSPSPEGTDPKEELKRFQQRLRDDALSQFNTKRRTGL